MANWDVTTAAASKLFDTDVGLYSACVKIDANHFLNFWRGVASDGFVQTFEVNTTTWEVTTVSAQLEYDTQLSQDISVVVIDTNHALAVWRGGTGITGKAQVFTVNTTTWATTTAAAAFTFDTQFNTYTALVQIDTNHFLNVWRGGATTADSWTQVLTVNTTTWAVTTAAAKLQFDTDLGSHFKCIQVDTNHFLNIWLGLNSDGYAQVFTVNTTTWAVTTAAAQFGFDTNGGSNNSIAKVDTNHFIHFWAGSAGDGYVEILEVNTTTWAVTTTATWLEFDTQNGAHNSVVKVDTNHFINFFAGSATTANGFVQVFTVNTTTWAVTTAAVSLEFDTQDTDYNSAVKVDTNHFINFWRGGAVTSDGWAQVFAVEIPTPGSSNIKTYNTNSYANIKSIDTNVIANVKSLNTNV